MVALKLKNSIIVDSMEAMMKLNGLPRMDAPTVGNLRKTKEHRYGKTIWVKNPLKVVGQAKEILAFKELSPKERSRMLRNAEEKLLHPRQLVTKQKVVAKKGVEHFICNSDMETRGPLIVLGVGKKNYVWNGNHRSCAALLTGRKIKVKFLRLK